MSDEVWTPSVGELVAERFRLVRELGRGGMGSVWKADHVGLQIPCALKFIHEDAEATDETRSRFRQEAHAAARLRNRHVVQMLDHGVWKGAPYIAMELLEGELLSSRIEKMRKLTPPQTLDIVRGVARALASAAELGIVHRDLKPENIFLVSEAGEEYPKVLDFGVAKLTQPQLGRSHRTKTGALIGTPWYMSPEQIDGTLEIDHRSDLWALSVITFQCVTGELPFQSTALGNLMLKICNGPRPVPSEIAPELARGFDGWWARASQRDPEARHATADEWLETLERSLDPNAPQPEEPPMAAVEPPKSRQTFEGHASNATQKGSSGWLLLLALIAVGAAAALFWPRDDDPADSPVTPASPQTGMTAIAPPDSEAPVSTPAKPPPSASATTPPPTSITAVPETPPPSEPPPAPPPEQPPAPQPDEP